LAIFLQRLVHDTFDLGLITSIKLSGVDVDGWIERFEFPLVTSQKRV
jgi:hypothetical protein